MKAGVIIRVDGSQKIGLGHLIRCIALAKMIESEFYVTFACKEIPDPYRKNIIEDGFEYWHVENEKEFLAKLEKNKIVVLDGYNFNFNFQTQIKQIGCKLVCIDDLHEEEFYVDLIINHAPSVKREDYRVCGKTEFALGMDYALLRPSFLKKREYLRNVNEIKNVMICFGGGDYLNLTLQTLKNILSYSFKRIIVVTGAAYEFSDSLSEVARFDNRIECHHSVSEHKMVELMLQIDLAIIPASGILMEMMTMNAKIVCGIYAANQKIFYERFLEKNIFFPADNFSKNNIDKAISKAIGDINYKRQSLDGKSGERVLEKFVDLSLSIRKVISDDELLLFNWANDVSVRRNALCQDPITWECHRKWFYTKVNSVDSHMFILERGGFPIGQIRYDRKENYYLIDFSIGEEYRGKGFGKKILKRTLPLIGQFQIRAMVKLDNIGSEKAFRALGFHFKDQLIINNEKYLLLELNNE